MKIGVGIVTYKRNRLFEKCFKSVSGVDELVVVDDGFEVDCNWCLHNSIRDEDGNPTPGLTILYNETNIGVGASKNKALKHLYDEGCDHIFLIEDDIFIKDPKVFEKYITASKRTGIQHFNFSQHGVMNKSWPGGEPAPVLVLDYKDLKVPLYRHCVGAFSYYSRKCLDEAGFICEDYYNAAEHVDHTLQIIKAGMHPPFWYFADIENSWEYLGDEEWSREKSTISSRPDHDKLVSDADQIFWVRNGCTPGQIPLTSESDVVSSIKEIKKNYGDG